MCNESSINHVNKHISITFFFSGSIKKKVLMLLKINSNIRLRPRNLSWTFALCNIRSKSVPFSSNIFTTRWKHQKTPCLNLLKNSLKFLLMTIQKRKQMHFLLIKIFAVFRELSNTLLRNVQSLVLRQKGRICIFRCILHFKALSVTR